MDVLLNNGHLTMSKPKVAPLTTTDKTYSVSFTLTSLYARVFHSVNHGPRPELNDKVVAFNFRPNYGYFKFFVNF
jgi:hypothetical protein